jgi:diguanylate cyclase (GGDEF)-like protein/PAS domain S-box-containing protein
LISWIGNQAETGGFCTEQLSAIYPVADSALPAGILAAPISKDMRSCILWLRIEKPKTVTWAGKAEKLVYSDEQGFLRLSPRHSFASWNETWRGRSSPWLPVEQGIAYPLAAALTESLSQKNQMHQVLTKQKLAEVELRLAASAFESQEGIVVTDPQGIILRVNTAFVHITGYQAEECIGKNPSLLKSWRHDQAFYREMWQKLLRDGAWKGEIWNKRKNGDIYAQHLTITAVKDADGKVKHFVGSYLDICETKAAQAEIERLAFYDPLTGLPNRRYLLDRLKPALASSARTGLHGAVLFIDLDNFKTLNDTLGHDQGDVLLKQVASRLTGCIREGDTLARLGGDEFIIMLENLAENALDSAALTEIVAHKIIATLSQPYGLAGRSFISTPSIGATLFNDQQTVSEELLKEADIAMYEAKKAGRNTVRFFDPNMQKVILARATLEADLRLAISDQQFVLYYQLQIDQQHCAIGAEVLIRWLHPQSGLISPITFIPLAEETGLIVPIGEWVLEMVCRQIRLWQNDPLFSKLEVAVNVSPRQFRQANFVENLQALLITYEINPLRLKLELTENILVEDIEAVVTIMNQLKQMGIQFSLDDFGTGYSSLQYLKRLPLDQLKIDRSFVQDMEFDDNDQAIVRTIIAMALALDLNVIAEGVESLQQKELLKNYGCGNFQGFLFSHPLPVAAFETLVKGQMTIAPVPDWNLKHD